MPEADIYEQLQVMHIHVQAVMLLRWRQRNQGAEDHPLTPHFTVSVARDLDVGKVRSITELCCLRIKVDA
jgi:hypothetical protein